MTILFLSRLFYPHGGGVERHVLEVGKRLVEKGYKIIVVTEELSKTHSFLYHSKAQSAKSTGSVFGIHIVRHGFGGEDWFKKFRVWKWLWQHRELIKNADIIHAHDVFFWYLPFRFLYPTKPVFTTFHGYETKFPPAKKAIFVRKLSEKLSWGNICVGDYIKKWYGTKADFITYGGVNLPKAQSAKLKVQSYNSKLKILFIGRLEQDIGIEIYIKALERLRNEKVNFEITFLGDGKYANQASQYGDVTTRHYNDTYHYSELLQKADVVFASSYLSILSALAAKRLVFAVYDNALKQDYLQMAPFAKWIIIEDSARKLAERIQYYRDHRKEAEKLIDGGYNWVREQTWEKVVGMYLKLWRLNS